MKAKLNTLKHDDEIVYLRHINPVFVSRYRQAMRNGDQFPPLVIEKGSNIIVSGNTRATAYREEFGESHDVEVTYKTFKNRAEMLEEAVRENAKHGNPLDGFSRRKFALKLIELGRKPEQVAQLFGVAVKRIEEWGGQTVAVRGMGQQPTKRGLEHISGQPVTKVQYTKHEESDRGMPIKSMAEQLTRWIENGWTKDCDEKTVSSLIKLHDALKGIIE
jgi:hypothetical protein